MEEKEIESNKISIDSIIDTVNNKNEVIQKNKKIRTSKRRIF